MVKYLKISEGQTYKINILFYETINVNSLNYYKSENTKSA